MAAVWRCPLCGTEVPLAGVTARPVTRLPSGAKVVHVRVPPSALADALAHTWAEHPEAVQDAT